MTNKINEVANYIMTQDVKSDIVKGVVKSSSKSPRSSSVQKARKKKESPAAPVEPKKRVSSKSKTIDSEPQPPSDTGSHSGDGEWDEIEFYCVKCKTKNKCKPGLIELEKDKRGSSRLKGMCTVCETKLYRYYSAPVESSGSGKE